MLCPFLISKHTPSTHIYTLSLHDALPISRRWCAGPGQLVRIHLEHVRPAAASARDHSGRGIAERRDARRSEEHTSELQSQSNLVCRLLLEKKKTEDGW